MRLFWRYEADAAGVHFELIRGGVLGRGKAVAVADWPADEKIRGVALMRHWLDREVAEAEAQRVTVPHQVVANLSEPQAHELDLPPAAPHALSLTSHGTLDEPGFRLSYQWLRFGTIKERLKRTGAIAGVGETRYRLPRTLFDLAESVDQFNEAETQDRADRLAAWEPVQRAVANATGESVRPDGYLSDLQVMHAGAFSLSLDIRADDIDFQPVLFGRRPAAQDPGAPDIEPEEEGDSAEPGGPGVDELLDEGDALLPEDAQEIFVKHRFGSDSQCRWAYPLKRNQYVVLDEPLREALNVVKHKQTASGEEKRAFLKNPRMAISEALGLEPDGREANGLFLETEQYAERVTGIQLWERKVIPWLPKPTNSWLPEKLGLQVGESVVELEPERVPELRTRFEEAQAANQNDFTFNDTQVPVSEETRGAIDYVQSVADQITGARDQGESHEPDKGGDDDPGEHTKKPYALETQDNIEELGYSLGLTPRRAYTTESPPDRLVDPGKLLSHQQEGFDWLVRSWRLGRPGVLLADDMGLGKTLQALAFGAWLDEQFARSPAGKRNPFLIVAPTALLQNWRSEHDKHLHNGGLGAPLEVYGSGVKQLRESRSGGRDIDVGAAGLNRERMRQASWILTTYETLANYHFSFASLPYSFVIFDEIQKIKTPNTINTHAAKTLNAEFVLGLTGTPIENRLSDIWSIMDRIHPGFLDDLQTFSETYKVEEEKSLEALHHKMTAEDQVPAVMLRRMKGAVDLGKALPARETREMPDDMPLPQAQAYETLLQEATSEGAGKRQMLSVLHKMRGISLHPREPKEVTGVTGEYESYIRESARLQQCVAVLDEVHEKAEKALVYVENRDMQELLCDIIRIRYKLSRTPRVINGQTPSAKRQIYADEFQNEAPGFSVLVLAPRAAGVGLTLHAANHVIHLSRWWNPAVEDQCNDRVYRIGQEKPVTVYCPMARHPAIGGHSFDLKLNDLLNRKRQMSRHLLVPAESTKDYEELFAAATESGK